MGFVRMSERDLKRIEVLTEILAGRRTAESGAAVMGLAWRQTFRLLARYKELGGASVLHQARGRTESAARVLNVSLRQAQRLLARDEDGGGAALIHKARGRPATNS